MRAFYILYRILPPPPPLVLPTHQVLRQLTSANGTLDPSLGGTWVCGDNNTHAMHDPTVEAQPSSFFPIFDSIFWCGQSMAVLDLLSSEFSHELYDAPSNTTYLFSPRAVTASAAGAACQATGGGLASLETPASVQALVARFLPLLPPYQLRSSLDLRHLPGVPLSVSWHGIWVGLGSAGRALLPSDPSAAQLLNPVYRGNCSALWTRSADQLGTSTSVSSGGSSSSGGSVSWTDLACDSDDVRMPYVCQIVGPVSSPSPSMVSIISAPQASPQSMLQPVPPPPQPVMFPPQAPATAPPGNTASKAKAGSVAVPVAVAVGGAAVMAVALTTAALCWRHRRAAAAAAPHSKVRASSAASSRYSSGDIAISGLRFTPHSRLDMLRKQGTSGGLAPASSGSMLMAARPSLLGSCHQLEYPEALAAASGSNTASLPCADRVSTLTIPGGTPSSGGNNNNGGSRGGAFDADLVLGQDILLSDGPAVGHGRTFVVYRGSLAISHEAVAVKVMYAQVLPDTEGEGAGEYYEGPVVCRPRVPPAILEDLRQLHALDHPNLVRRQQGESGVGEGGVG